MKEISKNRMTVSRAVSPDVDKIYTARLGTHLVRMLDHGGLSFPEIARLAGGAYPTDVNKVLRMLLASGKVIETNAVYHLPGGYRNRQGKLKPREINPVAYEEPQNMSRLAESRCQIVGK